MTRTWRPRPLVRERADGRLWAGALPDGPIVQLDDLAALLLETLLDATADGPAADVRTADVPTADVRAGDVRPGARSGERPDGADGPVRGASAAEVLARLDGVLEGVPEDAEATLEEFFAQLAAGGLVEECTGAAGSTTPVAAGPAA